MPTTETESPAATNWLRRAFIAAVLCLAIFQFSENTADVDLWGHVVFGQDFLTTGKLATTEPYSWTAFGQHWINHEIIAEVALAVAHRALGGSGLLLLKIIVGLLTFGVALSVGGRNSVVAWAFGALAVVEISFGFAARPQIFTALALASEFWLLRQIHDGRWRWAFALPLLFAVWINTHGGALAGIVLLLVAAITASLQGIYGKLLGAGSSRGGEELVSFTGWGVGVGKNRTQFVPPASGTSVLLWFFSVASVTALFVNPYGLELIRWLVDSVLWLRPEIDEWNPARLNADHAAFFLCAVIAAVSFLCSRRPLALWELACTGALGFMAFRSVRHTPLFCIAALAFVPPHLGDTLERFQDSFSRLLELCRRAAVRKFLAALLTLSALGILCATFTLHKERAWTMEVPRRQYPVTAIEFIKQHELRGNLLVFFDWGEQCIWELPDSRVSVDGRLDTCYPRSVIAAHWKLYNGEPFDEAAVPLDRADFALLPSNLAGSLALAKQRGWHAVYFDDTAVVLVKKTEQFPKLAGLSLPVAGPAENAKGRAAFPDRLSLRHSNSRYDYQSSSSALKLP